MASAPKINSESRIEWNSCSPASRNAPATAAAIFPGTESVPCCIRVINVMAMPPSTASARLCTDSGAVA